MTRQRQIPWRRRAIFAIVTLLLALPLAELAARLLDLDVDSGGEVHPERLLFQEIRRGPVEWDENITVGAKVYPFTEQYYNIARPLAPKPPGVTRVVCLGDSCTAGESVRPDQPYPQILERVLGACYPERHVEVWNFGRQGFSSYQGRLLAERLWAVARPDVLSFYFGANDAGPALIRTDREWERLPAWSLNLHRQFYTRSVLYRILRNINVSFLRRRSELAPVAGQPGAMRFRVPRQDFWANHAALQSRVESDGGFMLTVEAAGIDQGRVFPGPYFLDWQAGPDDLDLVALFGSEYASGRATFADQVHPNPHGHRLIARALVDKLAARWGTPSCDLEALLAAEVARDNAPPVDTNVPRR